MEWIYQGKVYTTIPIKLHWDNWHYQVCDNFKEIQQLCETEGLVWHSKWNKVYKLVNVAIAGNGHMLKAWIIDVYTDKEIVCCLQDLEIVKEKDS